MATNKRFTVKIKTDGDTTERDFHLFDYQVTHFVAKVEREGGTARVVPLQLGSDLRAMLTRVGVNPDGIK